MCKTYTTADFCFTGLLLLLLQLGAEALSLALLVGKLGDPLLPAFKVIAEPGEYFSRVVCRRFFRDGARYLIRASSRSLAILVAGLIGALATLSLHQATCLSKALTPKCLLQVGHMPCSLARVGRARRGHRIALLLHRRLRLKVQHSVPLHCSRTTNSNSIFAAYSLALLNLLSVSRLDRKRPLGIQCISKCSKANRAVLRARKCYTRCNG